MTWLEYFADLKKKFSEKGFSLFLVGGTVRDYLLGKELTDFDFATDAKPEEFIPLLDGFKVNDAFAHLGSVSIKNNEIKMDITTFREEVDYSDFRHPRSIRFVKNMELDSKRRDFSINAMYMDVNLRVYDFHDGQKDLKNKVIKMIGDPKVRFKEDPLRIIRALRFALMLDFSLDSGIKDAINEKRELLNNLTPEKVRSEIKKIKNVPDDKILSLFKEFNIDYLLKVID